MACFNKCLLAGFHSLYLVASGQQDAEIAICSLVSGAVPACPNTAAALSRLCCSVTTQGGNNHDTYFTLKAGNHTHPARVGEYFI